MAQITADIFKKKVGQAPIDDDLERCNCDKAGQVGHYQCGWCDRHEKPLYMCGHECLILSDLSRTSG